MRDVTPVAIVGTSGDVRGSDAWLHSGRGSITLTRTSTDTEATDVILDYGKDVGGLPYFVVSAESGSPDLHVSYSEGGQYADQPDGDTTRPRASHAPGRIPTATTTTRCPDPGSSTLR